jgi:hypothetical protein
MGTVGRFSIIFKHLRYRVAFQHDVQRALKMPFNSQA